MNPLPPPDIPTQLINLFCLEEVLLHTGGTCGCPECCAANGCTALYAVEDFEPNVHPCGWWPKVVCTEKLATLVKERIVPGWPGGKGYERPAD